MKESSKLKEMVKTALMIAICFISVYINIPIPGPSGGGLMHLGGVVIFLSATDLVPVNVGIVGGVGMDYYDLLYLMQFGFLVL